MNNFKLNDALSLQLLKKERYFIFYRKKKKKINV